MCALVPLGSGARGRSTRTLERMKRRRRTTASELMAELAKDPNYLATRGEQERWLAAFAAEFADEDALIAKEAASLGYHITSVWDFVNNVPHPVLERQFVGSYERAYPMLIRHLRLKHHSRIREGVIRALTVRDGGEAVWSALLDEFYGEQDPDMRWVLANALRTSMPYKLRRKRPEIAQVRNGATRSNTSLERTRER